METGQKSGPVTRYLIIQELEQLGSLKARRLVAAAEGQFVTTCFSAAVTSEGSQPWKHLHNSALLKFIRFC